MPDIRPTANSSALVLNATYEPLGVVSVRRATILVLSAKAVCLADGDGILHSERDTPPGPAGGPADPLRPGALPPHVGLSRRAIFARDGGRCAYCRGPAETIDHVMPRSRGGGTPGRTWSPPAPGATTPRATRRQPNSAGVCMPRPRAEGRRVAGARPPGPRPALGRVARRADGRSAARGLTRAGPGGSGHPPGAAGNSR